SASLPTPDKSGCGNRSVPNIGVTLDRTDCLGLPRGGRTSRFPLAATLPRSFRAVRQGRVSCSDALARWRRTRRGSSPLAGFLDPYWDLVVSRADWAKDVIPWDLFLRSESASLPTPDKSGCGNRSVPNIGVTLDRTDCLGLPRGGRTSRFPLAATLPRSFRAVRQGRVSCSDALARWRRTRRGSSPLAGFLDPYWDLVVSRADWAKDVIPWDLFLRSEVRSLPCWLCGTAAI
ncbi:hypothetical protein ISCGN_017802, partial [Ixodes scapularis]